MDVVAHRREGVATRCSSRSCVQYVATPPDYPEYRADVSNVLPLSKTHHAVFNRESFTLDQSLDLEHLEQHNDALA